MTTFPYEDENGERWLGVVATYEARDWNGRVLHDVSGSHPWIVTWTDGVNVWVELWHDVSVALTRFASLIRAAESNTFLVHDVASRDEGRYFEDLAERFISRVVHASSCQPGCDGTDPANHDV